MTFSMTAFARAGGDYPWGALVWEIRSVNHRYLEPTFKMQDSLRSLESELRDKLRLRVNRGKIECSLRLQRAANTGSALNVDENRLAQLLARAQQVQALLPASSVLNPLEILAWPGVLVEAETNEEVIAQAAGVVFEQALLQLVEHRAREGAALRMIIEHQLDGVAAIVERVRKRLPQLLDAQRQKLHDRLRELCSEVDAGRVEQEIVLLAQKSDVEEELDRIGTHLQEVRRALMSQEPCGRRLDFLMQELNREANTLSSKSIASDTTQSAVDLKVLVEQMREQVQNIE
ncbi:MAG: YicC/YloC family endoribonuclease [Spongiibacteraceae bacterium]